MPTPTVGPALVVSAILFTVASWTDVADACSYIAPPPALVGYPKEGDIQVSIDVVPFYDMNAAGIYDPNRTVDFSLTSSRGTVVPVASKQELNWTIELTPETELEPNTAYTLEATLPEGAGQVTRSLTFTTGSQRAAAPTPPIAFIEHYRLTGSTNSCSPPQTGTCVAFEKGPVVASFVDEFGQEHHHGLWQKPILSNLSGIDQGTNFLCMNLRSRGENGVLSTPISLCTADGPLLELTGSAEIGCSSQGLTQAGHRADVDNWPLRPGASSKSDAGCTLAPPSVGGLGWIGAGLALTGVLARRRRDSRRRSHPCE